MKYTVLLLYPDYIATDYVQETWLAHVTATDPTGAILFAQLDACENQEDYEIDDPNDWYTLFVCEGHHDDLTRR